jgi:hypothetical protein
VASARRSKRGAPPTSADLDSIEAELRYAGDRAEIAQTCGDIGKHLRTLEFPDHYWGYIEIGRAAKKNFAQKFSCALAQKIANALRSKFKGIYPDEQGCGHESRSQGAAGLKKIDVNYSTPQMGLGLAVSIKTVNFKDEKTGRYTKNIKRIDGELRAEAQDCHTRQPFSVLSAVILMPADAATDGTRSSLKHAWEVFHRRGGRRSKDDEASLFEAVFIGTYHSGGNRFGSVSIFDAIVEPPDRGLPSELVTLTDVIRTIEKLFKERNKR